MLQVIAKFRDQADGVTALVLDSEPEVPTRKARRFSMIARDDSGTLTETRTGLSLFEAVCAARSLTS